MDTDVSFTQTGMSAGVIGLDITNIRDKEIYYKDKEIKHLFQSEFDEVCSKQRKYGLFYIYQLVSCRLDKLNQAGSLIRIREAIVWILNLEHLPLNKVISYTIYEDIISYVGKDRILDINERKNLIVV